jgi:hypothetical protein
MYFVLRGLRYWANHHAINIYMRRQGGYPSDCRCNIVSG